MNDNQISEALTLAHQANLELWTDEKKDEFVQMFLQRVKVSRYLLEKTAEIVLQAAQSKSFISDWHRKTTKKGQSIRFSHSHYYGWSDGGTYHGSVGGRSRDELKEIAVQRAEQIISSLPSLASAVQVIDPDTADKLKKIKALKEKGVSLAQEADELSKPISMVTLDQNMTIGEFRKMVKDIDDKRSRILKRMHDIGSEASELQKVVDEKLFKGLPGLSDAVLDTVISFLDQSKALDTMGRRVTEQVKFGECAEAMALLQRFEEDEAKVSKDVSTKFKEAMEVLKLSRKSSSRKTSKRLKK